MQKGTTCGPCKIINPHLRQLAKEYPENVLRLIGVAKDQDFAALRAQIEEEKLTWPQICEGSGWEDSVVRLFNATTIPSAYVIDTSGNIACKIVGGDRGEELEGAVRSLIA